MEAARLWTVQEANAVLPLVSERLDFLREHVDFLLADEAGENLARARAEPGGGWPGREVAASVLATARILREFEKLGIVVRDLERGLVDFPAVRDGEVVYLCWLEGEPFVEHWHDPESGFAGRRPI